MKSRDTDLPFELLEELGTGQTGTVHRARATESVGDLQPGDEVAVKLLRRDLLDPDAGRRLDEEGRLGMRLRHDNLVHIHATDTAVPFVAMELVRGRTLRAFLDDSGSAVEELARRIGAGTASGLDALHRAGVVHRDVKPENVALTEEGKVKVMDLGLARQVDERRQPKPENVTGSSGFFGSIGYAAPELLRGGIASPKADLYSLGVMLFEVATGHHPFAPFGLMAMDLDDMIHAHLNHVPPRASHHKPRISAFLEQLISELLAKNPADRPDTAAVVEAFESGERSDYWRRHEARMPNLVSRRRLRALRRTSDVGFIGRKREVEKLNRILSRAQNGRGQAVQLSGPRGMGRRRLLDHWLERVLTRDEGKNRVVFAGAEAEQGLGSQRTASFSRILLDWYLRGDDEGSPLAESRLAARLQDETSLSEQETHRLAAIVFGSDQSSSPAERADLVVRALLDMGGRQTLILRIDRAEALSTTGELVVERLADQISEHRILLLLVSLRPRPNLRGVRNMPILGLEQGDYLRLGERLFAPGHLPGELILNSFDVLSGSPGALIDALSELDMSGQLDGSPGSYEVLEEIPELRPAGTLLDLLQQRMDKLEDEQRHVHFAAAILGLRFLVADLVEMTGRTELDILQALSAFQGRVIRTVRGEGIFRHRDFRRAILEMMPPAQRRQLHREAAWVLDERGAPPLDIGLHYSRAAEHEASLEPLLAGFESLVATGSRKHRSRVAARIEKHLAELPRTEQNLRRRLRYLLLVGQAHRQSEDGDLARRVLRKAAAMARVLRKHAPDDDPLRLSHADALIQLADVAVAAGDFKDAEGRLEAVEELLRHPKTPAERYLLARSLVLEARTFGYVGQSEAALGCVRLAIKTLPASDLGMRLAPHVNVDLARLEALRNHFGAALKNLDRAARLFEESGSRKGLLRVNLHRGHVLASVGEREKATKLLQDTVARAQELSDRRAQAKAMLFLGEQAILWEEDSEAIPHLLDCVSLTARSDRVTRILALLYLRGMGIDTALTADEVIDSGVPALHVHWNVLEAYADRSRAVQLLSEALELEKDTMLPLHLHRFLLRAAGKDKKEQALVDGVAARLSGSMRKKFQALVRR